MKTTWKMPLENQELTVTREDHVRDIIITAVQDPDDLTESPSSIYLTPGETLRFIEILQCALCHGVPLVAGEDV